MAIYKYDGNYYQYGRKVWPQVTYYTTATDIDDAYRKTVHKIAGKDKDKVRNTDLIDSCLTLVSETSATDDDMEMPMNLRKTHLCPECGTTLTDAGECPLCVWGDNND